AGPRREPGDLVRDSVVVADLRSGVERAQVRVQRLDDAVTVHVVVATHRVGSTLGVRVLRLGAGRVLGAMDGDVLLGGALRAVVAWRAVVDVTVYRHGS